MNATARPYTVPRPKGTSKAMILAIVTHGLLFVLLFFGIRWQSETPAVIEAELWSSVPQVAAPPTPPAPPQPKVVEPPVEKTPEPTKPDIAIKDEKPKKPQPKPEPKPPPKPEPKPQPKAEAKPAPARPPSDLERLMAQAGQPSTGDAAQNSGPRGSNEYVAAIQAKIRSNLRFPPPPDMVGNPEATFVIEQLPTGEIIAVSMKKSSGLPAFDAAAERAIKASSPLPRDKAGQVVRRIELGFRPLELP